jgi:polysaccharide biosynthesis/export protein
MKNIITTASLFNTKATAGLTVLLLTLLALGLTGCQTDNSDPFDPNKSPNQVDASSKTNLAGQLKEPPHSESLILSEGDVLKIAFPGSPNLDNTQPIRRDGKISLQLAGEITASGKTPSALEKEIADAYGSQLLNKEVSVTVISSSISVFVTGAVLNPHKVISDHPITALEAIMEAGGFDYSKADLKDVRVIRYEKDRQHTYQLNLKLAMEGKQSEPFPLKPYDIVYVPERFTWF